MRAQARSAIRARCGACLVGPAVGQDEHDPGGRAGGGQVAVEERLEVAHRGRQVARLLDLEGELAGAGAVGPAAHDQQLVAVVQLRGRRRRGRPRRRARPRPARPTARGVDRRPRRGAGQREAGRERRDVADGVAPRASTSGVASTASACRGRLRLGPGGDEPGGRPGRARRTQRLRRRPGAALVRDADHARRRACGSSDASNACARDGGDPGLAQHLGDAQRRVLARAAADDRQRPVAAARAGPARRDRRPAPRPRRSARPGRARPRSSPASPTAAPSRSSGKCLGVVPVVGHVEIALSVSVAGSSRPPRCSARNSSAAAWNARLFSGLRNPWPSSANSM